MTEHIERERERAKKKVIVISSNLEPHVNIFVFLFCIQFGIVTHTRLLRIFCSPPLMEITLISR